ncbi:unnamed protein product [Orchesella dallaii]|uniref:17-beta-hydroxysteroid dehydrogenase 13 n=1 Tax=Orchesella dallaii TaxID=48710 RepID=A0ABP1R7M5_9HEXA
MESQNSITDVAADTARFIVDLPYFIFIYIRAVIGLLVQAVLPKRKKSLDGEVILITGAASGIGRNIVLKLAKLVNNAAFVLWDINEAGLLKTAEECRSSDIKVYPYVVDLSSQKDIIKTAEKVKSEVGVVTILFNNAGLSDYSEFLNANPVREEKVIKVNLFSYMWTIREFLPDMIERGEGHLVQTCSGLGFWRFNALTSYCASKYGLRGFIRTLQLEMRMHTKKPNIKFSTIYPGWVKTPMLDVVSWEPRYKTFMTPMDPDYVCDKIIEGIQKETEEIMIPQGLAFLDKVSGFTPRRFFDEFEAFTMRNFTHTKNNFIASSDSPKTHNQDKNHQIDPRG